MPTPPPTDAPTPPTLKRPAPDDSSPPAKKPALDAERQRTRRLFGSLIAPGPRAPRQRRPTSPPPGPRGEAHPLSRLSAEEREKLQRRVEERDRRVARENAGAVNGLVTKTRPGLVWLPKVLTEEQKEEIERRRAEVENEEVDDRPQEVEKEGEDVQMEDRVVQTTEAEAGAGATREEPVREDEVPPTVVAEQDDASHTISRERSMSYDEPAHGDGEEDTVVY